MMDLPSQERDRCYRSHHRRRILCANPRSRKSLRTEQSANARIARINILTILEYMVRNALL